MARVGFRRWFPVVVLLTGIAVAFIAVFPHERGWMLAAGAGLMLAAFFWAWGQARVRQTAEAAARALEASEERFRQIIESATDFAIFSTDLEGRVTSWNLGAERLFGFSESEILGRNGRITFTPEDQAAGAPEAELSTAAEKGRALDERWHQRKDGSRMFLSGMVRPLLDPAGRRIGFTKVARDITAKLLAQENLRREKEFSDTIINSLPGVFYLFDRHGKFLRWNETVQSISGYSAAEIRGMGPLDFIAEEDRPAVSESIRRTLRDGQATVTAELETRDGRRIPHVFSGRRALITGEPCIIGMGVDISEQKRAEHELRAIQQQLRNYTEELEERVAERTAHLAQSLQSLEGVLYHVAHDLRAPLRAMASFTNLILEEYAPRLDDTGRDYARRVVTAAERMDHLVQDLLAYGRIAHMAIPVGEVDLEAEVNSVLDQFAKEIRSLHANVEVRRPLPPVRANAALMNEILVSLFSNALKFVPPGTPPRVRVRAEERETGPDVHPSVRLWVEDNGIGIKPEYHERIFRMFERLHGVDAYPGTGIGLAIVRKGIERLGGRVGLESRPGEGCRFWVELPRAVDGQNPD